MSQRNIADLPRPPKGFRPDKDTRRKDGKITFEKPGFCREEDTERAKGWRRAAKNHSGVIDVGWVMVLADQLEHSGDRGTPTGSRAR